MDFGRTISVEDFKVENNVSTLQVVLNPKNDKLFVVGGGKTLGAVSSKLNKSKEMMFVELLTDDGPIWCLCNGSSENVQFEL